MSEILTTVKGDYNKDLSIAKSEIGFRYQQNLITFIILRYLVNPGAFSDFKLITELKTGKQGNALQFCDCILLLNNGREVVCLEAKHRERGTIKLTAGNFLNTPNSKANKPFNLEHYIKSYEQLIVDPSICGAASKSFILFTSADFDLGKTEKQHGSDVYSLPVGPGKESLLLVEEDVPFYLRNSNSNYDEQISCYKFDPSNSNIIMKHFRGLTEERLNGFLDSFRLCVNEWENNAFDPVLKSEIHALGKPSGILDPLREMVREWMVNPLGFFLTKQIVEVMFKHAIGSFARRYLEALNPQPESLMSHLHHFRESVLVYLNGIPSFRKRGNSSLTRKLDKRFKNNICTVYLSTLRNVDDRHKLVSALFSYESHLLVLVCDVDLKCEDISLLETLAENTKCQIETSNFSKVLKGSERDTPENTGLLLVLKKNETLSACRMLHGKHLYENDPVVVFTPHKIRTNKLPDLIKDLEALSHEQVKPSGVPVSLPLLSWMTERRMMSLLNLTSPLAPELNEKDEEDSTRCSCFAKGSSNRGSLIQELLIAISCSAWNIFDLELLSN